MLGFVGAPSDIVPGVYEGGLKTWECSLDLVDCLDGILEGDVQNVNRKHALEVCTLVLVNRTGNGNDRL